MANDSLNRAAAIRACMESQGFAHAAAKVRNVAKIVEKSKHPKGATAVKVLTEIADELDKAADDIAAPYDGAKGALESVREDLRK